ncbi:MAG: pyruvate dehydrogenase (acetyl-transferring) E1 component subunit alpha [Betaproteobacteria bacterium]|nr:pyruvate dehydrogenase (acetyl-transferring) E1 component subunit alpha [Betaproteobacteria bacterium]
MSVVARFEIRHTQFLNHLGEPTQPLPDFARDPDNLIPYYRAMVLTRTYDAKAVALQRTGQLGTVGSSLGQEAIGTVVGSVMQREDVFLPTYREAGAQIARGVTMTELLRYWSGDERGSDYRGPRQDFPVCITIAAQCAHAVGVAYALKLRKEPRVAVTMMGDGATSKGDFYESLNMAGTWHLPVVFVIANNQWAISVPRSVQSAAETLAQKAVAAGIPGEQVDGNDVVALRYVFDQALQRARSGDGPTLIEALSYRLTDHTTADDARRYRDPEDVSRHWAMEPVARLRNYLVLQKVWGKDDEEKLIAECNERVQAAVNEYLATPPPPPGAMFEHLYATLPAALAWQRDAAASGKIHG